MGSLQSGCKIKSSEWRLKETILFLFYPARELKLLNFPVIIHAWLCVYALIAPGRTRERMFVHPDLTSIIRSTKRNEPSLANPKLRIQG